MNKSFVLKNKIILKKVLKNIHIINANEQQIKLSNKNIILEFLKVMPSNKYIKINNFKMNLNNYTNKYINNFINNNYKLIINLINNYNYKINKNISKIIFSSFLPYNIFLDITLSMNYCETIKIKYKNSIINFNFYYKKI